MAPISDIIAKINKCICVSEDRNSIRNAEISDEHAEGSPKEDSDSDAPKGGSVLEDPPNGGIRAWLIVVSCSAINVLMGVLELVVALALFQSEEDVGMDEDTLTEIYHVYLSLSSVYAPIASVSMVTLGYELTIHIGSWCLAVSFLILSFVQNAHGIKFLLYVTAGVGSSLVHLGVLIPVLEYFTTKRMRALMFTKISRYCGQIIPIVIYLSGATMKWQTLYRICMGLSIPIGVIGLTIPSLKLKPGKDQRSSFIERSLRLVHMKTLKHVYLWLVCFLFFIYQIGVEPPDAELKDTDMAQRLAIEATAERILYSLTPVIGLIAGAFLGWLFKFSFQRKCFGCMKQTPTAKELFNLIMVIMVAVPFLMAVMCFIAPGAANFPYFFIFSIFFHTQLAFVEELRDEMIPDVFGLDNVKFVEGLIQMFIGIAGIIATESAVDLHWKDSFRMGGGMFFTTSAGAVCLVLLQSDVGAKIIKINPIVIPDIEEPRNGVDSLSTASESETSEIYVTPASGSPTEAPASGSPTEAARNHELSSLQNDSLRYQFQTSHGPSNIRYVIPRTNRMYGSRETSTVSSDDSIESSNSSSADLHNNRTHAIGRTVYTDLQASRSPDSYGIVQTNGHVPYSFNNAPGGITHPSQYVIYSYNVTQNTDEV